jgi:CspA family cold shock protein
MSSSSSAVTNSSERFTGRVKWFNNKAGYGFITVTDGHKSGSDVFVHHSSIKVDSEQYKYLVQGEYIEFCLNDTGSVGDHEFQAGDVCGIKGGKLMCETRRDSRVARSQYRTSRPQDSQETSEPVKMPRSVAAPRDQRTQRPARVRGEGPREENSEWTYVARTKKGTESTSAPTQAPVMTRAPSQRGSTGRGRGRPSRGGRGQDHQV